VTQLVPAGTLIEVEEQEITLVEEEESNRPWREQTHTHQHLQEEEQEEVLTSRECRQCQQKECLQILQTI